jgi:hypothetical protein
MIVGLLRLLGSVPTVPVSVPTVVPAVPTRRPSKVDLSFTPSSWDPRRTRDASMDGRVDSTLSIRKNLSGLETAKRLSCFIVVGGCDWRRRYQDLGDMSRRKRGRLYP